MKILPRLYTLRGQGFPSPLRGGGLGWGVYFHGKSEDGFVQVGTSRSEISFCRCAFRRTSNVTCAA